MLRSWFLGLFVLGLTAYCCARAVLWPSESADGREAVDPNSTGDRPEGGPSLDETSPGQEVLHLAGIGEEGGEGTLRLEDVKFVTSTDQEAEMLDWMRNPLRGNPATGPLVLDFDGLDLPGGARRVSPEDARRVAIDAVMAARTCQESGGDPVAVARHLTRAILSGGLSQEEEEGAYESLLKVNRHGLLDRGRDHGCFREVVNSGDSLWSICNRLEQQGHPPLAPGLVQMFNGLANSRISAGQSLRIPKEALSILVRASRFELYVMVGDVMIRRFPVALGKESTPTPLGEFRIATREKNPTWFRPGGQPVAFGEPGNVLGTRWLGFAEKPDFPNSDTFGIHGTIEPNSVGTLASNGCVRLLNEDVEELFDWVPLGARVLIEP